MYFIITMANTSLFTKTHVKLFDGSIARHRAPKKKPHLLTYSVNIDSFFFSLLFAQPTIVPAQFSITLLFDVTTAIAATAPSTFATPVTLPAFSFFPLEVKSNDFR